LALTMPGDTGSTRSMAQSSAAGRTRYLSRIQELGLISTGLRRMSL
jgi:hypothetical protein